MLLQGWLNCDTVTLYTINPEQEKYTMMRDFFDEVSCKLLTLADPETVTPVENVDNQDLKVVIFDDKIDKRNMDKTKEYFSLSRNKNCTCIYLCQSYYDVPKYIRRNTRCFLLFNNLDNRDVRTIAHDQCQGLKKVSLREYTSPQQKNLTVLCSLTEQQKRYLSDTEKDLTNFTLLRIYL